MLDGYRESEQSWKELLLDVQGSRPDGRSRSWPPATAPWASGRRCGKVFPDHARAALLGAQDGQRARQAAQAAAARGQGDAARDLDGRDTKADADKAFDLFVATYQAKYPKATECLAKDRDELLTFYDFPAEHWMHLRTTNPIESTFATVPLAAPPDQRQRHPHGLPDDGLQADAVRRKEVAAVERFPAAPRRHSRSSIHARRA